MKKSIAALALAGIIALAGTAPAVASTYPAPGNEQGTVSDGTIAAGESITFAGTGYIGGETINVTFERTGGKKDSEGERPAPSSFSVIADGAGAFSTSITFTDSGRYTISAVGATSGNTRWAAVTVNAGKGGGNGGGGKGSSGFTGASSVTAVGANGQADTAADSSLVLWSLVGGGALAASAASAALIRRAKAKA
ncbi:hypothetical protein [Paenarthrobacter aromaticivorans]|uniref:hypothetical protein n=1 Tax=Paenarthrobacter aromaticivorans TaxID=2849150 RepID=UPI003A80A92D